MMMLGFSASFMSARGIREMTLDGFHTPTKKCVQNLTKLFTSLSFVTLCPIADISIRLSPIKLNASGDITSKNDVQQQQQQQQGPHHSKWPNDKNILLMRQSR